MLRGPLGLLPDDASAAPAARPGRWGTSLRKSAKPDDRGERVVEVVRDAGDELADGGHFFRLDELVLQSAPFRLIIEEEHDGGPVGAANRHGGNRIGPLAGAELHLAARSLLVQRPLQVRGPFGRNERLPGPADQARRAAHSPGRQRRGWPGGSGRRGPRCRARGRWRPPPPARIAGRRRAGPPGGRSRARCSPARPGPRAARATAGRSGRAHRGSPRRRLPWPWRRTGRAASSPPPSACGGEVALGDQRHRGRRAAPAARGARRAAAGRGGRAGRRARRARSRARRRPGGRG